MTLTLVVVTLVALEANAGSPTTNQAPAAPVAPTARAAPVADNAARLDLALRAYGLASAGYRQGNVQHQVVAMWSTRLYELQKEAGAAAAGTDYVYRMKDLENIATARLKDGRGTQLEVLDAAFLRAEAELVVKRGK
jgi:hypothetical protein